MTPGGHCVRGEHFTSCFCRHDVLRFGGVDDWCQANGATRCATGPALRDIMSVHEAGRCQQEHHGVEQASAEIGASFWAGGRGGSRGRQSVPIGMPLNDAKSRYITVRSGGPAQPLQGALVSTCAYARIVKVPSGKRRAVPPLWLRQLSPPGI